MLPAYWFYLCNSTNLQFAATLRVEKPSSKASFEHHQTQLFVELVVVISLINWQWQSTSASQTKLLLVKIWDNVGNVNRLFASLMQLCKFADWKDRLLECPTAQHHSMIQNMVFKNIFEANAFIVQRCWRWRHEKKCGKLQEQLQMATTWIVENSQRTTHFYHRNFFQESSTTNTQWSCNTAGHPDMINPSFVAEFRKSGSQCDQLVGFIGSFVRHHLKSRKHLSKTRFWTSQTFLRLSSLEHAQWTVHIGCYLMMKTKRFVQTSYKSGS